MADSANRVVGAAVKKGLAKNGAKVVGRIGGSALAAVSPLETLEAIITSYAEYKKVASQEGTKRGEIRARRDVELEKIAAQREFFLTYLELTFDERKANFAKFFEVIDHAVETDSVEVIAKTLESITVLAKSSPFKDITTVAQVRRVLDDPEEGFDL